MTIQQMMVASTGNLSPLFIGSNSKIDASGSSVSISTPSNTAAGDLLVFFGSGTGGLLNDLNFTWTNSNMTEIADLGTSPNMYCAWRRAASSGSTTHSWSLSANVDSVKIVVAVFRFAKVTNSNTLSDTNKTSVNLSINPTVANSTFVGFATSNTSGSNLSVNGSPTSIRRDTSPAPFILSFYKENQSSQQVFTFSGFSTSEKVQCALLALAPA